MEVRCPRCEAPQQADRNFCTRCGYELGARPSAPASAPAPAVEPRFLACPTCGATNAASRRRCGRCGAGLHDDDAPPAEAAQDPGAEADEWTVQETGSPIVFGAAVTVAGLAIIGIILTILSASGVLSGEDEAQEEPADQVLPVSSVRASSELPPVGDQDHAPENLLDGDPTTSWRESASGQGVGEWIELKLEGSREVTRLLVWNGQQRDGRFRASGRVGQLEIELGDRTFTADLLDLRGPQAVDLPEPVEASTIRLTILEVVEGGGPLPDVALSGVEVRGPPGSPDPS